jgi:hypothetical protein
MCSPGASGPVVRGSMVVKNSPNSFVDGDPTTVQSPLLEMLIVTRCRGGKAEP